VAPAEFTILQRCALHAQSTRAKSKPNEFPMLTSLYITSELLLLALHRIGGLMTTSIAPTTRPASKLARFLDKRLDELKGTTTLADIARKIGYPRGHIISMFRADQAKVPLDKIPLLAEALGVDAGHLMRLGLEQYWPGKMDVITKVFSRIVSDNEFELIQEIRERTSDADPKLTVADLRDSAEFGE
jgi:hypothetical protein